MFTVFTWIGFISPWTKIKYEPVDQNKRNSKYKKEHLYAFFLGDILSVN